jgi:DNA repair protein RecN (Recombination protein N)
MLTDLHIRNLAIVTDLNLECQSGMTAITGETGAGKSILIDALSLALGERADSSLVRPGSPRAEITLNFDISQLPQVQKWLDKQELAQEQDCLIRRTINADGRSRAYINDQSVTLPQLRELGSYLLDIHGQHAYHSLLQPGTALNLLDGFAGNQTLCQNVREAYQAWQHTAQQLAELQRSTQERETKLELLQFQLEELTAAELEQYPWEKVVQEHQQLAHAEQLVQQAQQVTEHLNSDQETNAINLLQHALVAANKITAVYPQHKNISELLNTACVQAQEALVELRHFLDNVNINPQKLAELDTRMANLHTLARKQRCGPENLAQRLAQIQQEYNNLLNATEHQTELHAQLEKQAAQYKKVAALLSTQRQKAAKKLSTAVTAQLPTLALPHAKFMAELVSKTEFSINGQENCDFIVQTNPGHPPQPLGKIASGGELSRISLAIQVVTAQTSTTPVLVFDEVDVGISGATASMVGQLLKQLSQHTQIFCVTHQPQVAVYSDQHWLVQKTTTKDHTSTQIISLAEKERTQEIARMLGGVKITQQTLAHAQELLEQAQ